MNREIKFRGKRVDNGQWIYGNINYLQDGVFILENDQQGVIEQPDYHHQGMGCGLEDRNITDRYEAMEYGWESAIDRQSELLPLFIEVHPETVGQYTGLKDKDGKEIYEGDKFEGDEGVDFYAVEWIDEEAIFGVSLYGQAMSFGEGSQEVYDSEISRIDRNAIGVNDMCEDLVIGTIHDNPELIK